jgi:hypothetical protein
MEMIGGWRATVGKIGHYGNGETRHGNGGATVGHLLYRTVTG